MSTPVVDRYESNIRSTIKMLRAEHGHDATTVANAAGMSRGTLYAKLKGESDFTTPEIGRLAEFWNEDVSTFYNGLRRTSPTGGTLRPKIATKVQRISTNVLVAPFGHAATTVPPSWSAERPNLPLSA